MSDKVPVYIAALLDTALPELGLKNETMGHLSWLSACFVCLPLPCLTTPCLPTLYTVLKICIRPCDHTLSFKAPFGCAKAAESWSTRIAADKGMTEKTVLQIPSKFG